MKKNFIFNVQQSHKKKIGAIFIWALAVGGIFQGCQFSKPNPYVESKKKHLVLSGETIHTIAKDYDLTPRQLMELNQLSSPELKEGMILKIECESLENTKEIPQEPQGEPQWVEEGEALPSASPSFSKTEPDPFQSPAEQSPAEISETALDSMQWREEDLGTALPEKKEEKIPLNPQKPQKHLGAQQEHSKKDDNKGDSKESLEEKKISDKKEASKDAQKNSDLSGQAKEGEVKKSEKSKKISKGEAAELSFEPPVHAKIIQKFGEDCQGVVYETSAKAPIRSTEAGTVIYSEKASDGIHSLMIVQHKNGLLSAYLGNFDVKKKDKTLVKKGDVLGEMREGTLEFQVRKDRNPLDPEKLLKEK